MTGRSGLHRVTAATLLGAAACLAAGLAGLRINTSSSLPLGLYARSGNEMAELIEFCPEEPFASVSRDRGYRITGFSCPDGAVPLVKPIVAQVGDTVEVSRQGIAVNGRLLRNTAPLAVDALGRPLTAWPTGAYSVEAGTVWVASTYSRGSYDSRYMGPIDVRLIRGRLRPLCVLHG